MTDSATGSSAFAHEGWTSSERAAGGIPRNVALPSHDGTVDPGLAEPAPRVSASSNRSKSDQDLAEWQPPSTAWNREYAREWINVKYYWDLDVDSAGKSAVEGMLDTSC